MTVVTDSVELRTVEAVAKMQEEITRLRRNQKTPEDQRVVDAVLDWSDILRKEAYPMAHEPGSHQYVVLREIHRAIMNHPEYQNRVIAKEAKEK